MCVEYGSYLCVVCGGCFGILTKSVYVVCGVCVCVCGILTLYVYVVCVWNTDRISVYGVCGVCVCMEY